MKSSVLTSRAWALLIAAALLTIAGALNFQQRLRHKSPPTDGIKWTQTANGIVAEAIDPASSVGRAGVLSADAGVRVDEVLMDGEANGGDAVAKGVTL